MVVLDWATKAAIAGGYSARITRNHFGAYGHSATVTISENAACIECRAASILAFGSIQSAMVSNET
uniref:hypothetical protein n=1 Tax=Nocardia cyriacigeorgica TaxID=135487 RepID=UPI002453C685